jgi:phosphatidylinositol 4-phosphatase
VLGLIELSGSKFVVVATTRKLAATIQAHKVWKITAGDLIPLGIQKPLSEMSDDEVARHAFDLESVETLKKIIFGQKLYFSSTYDLTHSLQHNYLQKTGKAVNTTIDDRYFFNQYLMSSIVSKVAAKNWVTKIICGFAGMVDMDCAQDIDGKSLVKSYTVTLISRLNHRRLGTRYIRRGIDSEGTSDQLRQRCKQRRDGTDCVQP